MADTADEIRAELEKQVKDLKSQVSKLSKSLAEKASDALDTAEDYYEEGRGRANQMARSVRKQAYVAADIARENPTTTATVLTTIGLIGLITGMVLGGLMSDRR